MASAVAMAEYMVKEAAVPGWSETRAKYYGAGVMTADGAISPARIRAKTDASIASVLGIDLRKPLTIMQVASLMAGLRADGGPIPGKRQQTANQKPAIAYVDFCLSAPKSFSVALELAETAAERAVLDKCHTDAVDTIVDLLELIVGTVKKGASEKQQREAGHIAAVMFDHHIARSTLKVANGNDTDLVEVNVTGDMQRHTHVIVPATAVTDEGRVGAIDQQAIKDRVHEIGSLYQAFLATNLRRQGVEVELDSRANVDFNGRMARLTAIPQWVSDFFSRRTTDGEHAARSYAKERGLDYDALSPEHRKTMVGGFVAVQRQMKDQVPDVERWRREAKEIGYRHRSVLRPGREVYPAAREDRHPQVYETSMPLMSAQFDRRAVIEGWVPRVAAAKGFIQHGIEDVREVNDITAAYRTEGVDHDGVRTNIHWAFDPAKRFARLTTQLSVEQESEIIAALRAAYRDKSVVVSQEALQRAIDKVVAEAREDGKDLDFTKGHGKAQREIMDKIAAAGRAFAVVGVAGSGKSTMLFPLIEAWHEDGREVYGATLAWRQTQGLKDAGIGKQLKRTRFKPEPDKSIFLDAGLSEERTFALTPLLSRMAKGDITLTANSVLVVDEIALVGTKQMLQLARFQREQNFQLVMIGDDKQNQAQPLYCKVLTPTGFRLMGDLAVGDLVLTPSGEAVPINAVTPRGQVEIFKVTFSDGRQTECCGDHLWKVWDERGVYSPGSHATRVLQAGADKWRVLSLSEISAWFEKGMRKARHASVPLVSPFAIERPTQILPIPPYALGLLLGDGHFARSTVRYSSNDPYLVQMLAEELPDYKVEGIGNTDFRITVANPESHFRGRFKTTSAVGLKDFERTGGRREVVVSYNGETKTVSQWAAHRGIDRATLWRRIAKLGWSVDEALEFVARRVTCRKHSPLSIALSGLGLADTRSHDKFIPEIYKIGSIAQRLAILRGLLDTDGAVGIGGTFAMFVTTSPHLAEGVTDIARSLGAIVTMRTKIGVFNGVAKKRQYLLNICHPDIGEFFALPRKKERLVTKTKRSRLRIKSIEPIGKRDAQCISIAHPEHLYVTDDYIVTHNCVEQGATIDLARHAFGAVNVPELTSNIRQLSDRDKATTLLFRDGKALEALNRKDEDGTLSIVPGGYDDAIRATVDILFQRQEATKDEKNYTIGVNVPTNADVLAIGEEIHRRRAAKGDLIKLCDVDATDGKGSEYRMEISAGDKLRLFKRVRGRSESGRSEYAGDNGTVVEAISANEDGLKVRKPSGGIASIPWSELREWGGERMLLTRGDAITIDTRQSETVSETIWPMPAGSSGVTSFKAYVSESRHRYTSRMIISQGAEKLEIESRRPIGDPRNDETDPVLIKAAVIANVARNLSESPKKTLSTDFLDRAVNLKSGTINAMQAAWLRQETRPPPPAEPAQPAAAAPPSTAGSNNDPPRIGIRWRNKERVAAEMARRAARATPGRERPAQAERPAKRARAGQTARHQEQTRRTAMTPAEAQAEFAGKLRDTGLILKGAPIMDGKARYVPVIGGKKTDKRGTYVGFADGMGGWAHNHKTGQRLPAWRANGRDNQPVTPEDAAAQRRRIEADRVARESERRQAEEAGAAQALAIWKAAKPTTKHAYLDRKDVPGIGLRVAVTGQTAKMGDDKEINIRGRLLIPMRDTAGKIWNLQMIDSKGGKYFLPGRKQGLMHVLGHRQDGDPLVFAEGYATAATLFSSTSLTSIVTFDKTNMVPVARAVHDKAPDNPKIFAGDNDHHLAGVTRKVPAGEDGSITVSWAPGATGHAREGNTVEYRMAGDLDFKTVAKGVTDRSFTLDKLQPGAPYEVHVYATHHGRPLTNVGTLKAQEAAEAVGGTTLIPKFAEGHPGTDWNDYGKQLGKQAVRAQFEERGIPMPLKPRTAERSTVTTVPLQAVRDAQRATTLAKKSGTMKSAATANAARQRQQQTKSSRTTQGGGA